MDGRQVGAEASFCRVLALLKEARKSEIKAREEPGCERGMFKMAAKHRADAHVLIMDGLIETAQPWG